ncbi:MAG: hypothetical protein QXO67_02785 [Candidatus Bathyarchaeia archaeon]
MVETKILIVAKPNTDTYPRRFGKAVDKTLQTRFWETQPETVLKDPATGADLITSSAFRHEQTLDLAEGLHTIAFAPSSPRDYTWEAEIFVNGKSLGKNSDVTYETQYFATFEVVKPPPTLAETISSFMGTFMGIMMLVMVISLMRAMMAGLKARA